VEASQILDFSSSINPLGPPSSAHRAFRKSFGELPCYPDSDARELRENLARLLGLKPQEVFLGNGSTQLIYLLCRALRPRNALVVHPAFSEYTNALMLAGSEIYSYILSVNENFKFSLSKFRAALKENPDIVFVSNPNSVTGRTIPRGEMEKITWMAHKKKTLLVIDEAFMDFMEGNSVKDRLRENPYLIVLRSPTKYYALPGLRLGYLLAQKQTVDRLCLHQEPWSVNTPAQRVFFACLNDESFRRKTKRWLEREREFLLKSLSFIQGLRPYPSQANFLLVRLEQGDALGLRALLLKKRILIRACDSFAGLGVHYFRVAIRLRKENIRLLKALEEIMGKRPYSRAPDAL